MKSRDIKLIAIFCVLMGVLVYEATRPQLAQWGNCHIVNTTGYDILVCP